MLMCFGHGVDPTAMLLFLVVVPVWLLSIVVGVVWVFMWTPDGWKRRVRHGLVATNLLGSAAGFLFGGGEEPTGLALCGVSLVVAVLLVVLRNSPAGSTRLGGPPGAR